MSFISDKRKGFSQDREIRDNALRVKKLEAKTDVGYEVYFDDQYTDASPLLINEGLTADLDINANSEITSYKADSGDLYDSATGKLTPIKEGDSFSCVFSFFAKSNVMNGVFRISIDIGGSFGKTFEQKGRFDEGANVYEPFYFNVRGYQLDTFLANGGQPKIESIIGNNSFKDFSIQIHRETVA